MFDPCFEVESGVLACALPDGEPLRYIHFALGDIVPGLAVADPNIRPINVIDVSYPWAIVLDDGRDCVWNPVDRETRPDEPVYECGFRMRIPGSRETLAGRAGSWQLIDPEAEGRAIGLTGGDTWSVLVRDETAGAYVEHDVVSVIY